MRVIRLAIALTFCLVTVLATGPMDHAKASPATGAPDIVAPHSGHAHAHDHCAETSCKDERPEGQTHSCATMIGHCAFAFIRGDSLQIVRLEPPLRATSGLPEHDIAAGIEPEADTPPPRS